MDILVTGGTVFVSRYTAEYFAEQGHNVYVLNRGSRPQSPKVTPIIADRHALGSSLSHRHFDAVIDAAAYTAEDITCLLDGLDSFGSYFFISSSAVYPQNQPQPFTEASEVGENIFWGRYGTDKIAAEKALLQRVPDAYIIRPPYLCGPMNNLYREAFVFECADLDRPFYLPKDGQLKLQFFHIGDLCRFIEKLLIIQPSERIFNVGYPQSITVRDWAALCYEAAGKSAVFEYVHSDVPQRSFFPFYDYEYQLDVKRMLSIMDCLTPIRSSMTASYQWYRCNRELIVKKPLLNFIDHELLPIFRHK